MSAAQDIAAVVIGRNEGQRLIECLDALQGQVGRIVYVDSGSSDGSQAAAQARNAELVALDMAEPFTAARARNAGLAALSDAGTAPEFVQFLDGDCTLQPGWIATARGFLETHPEVAIACGRRRERFPGASAYNRMIDDEWDTPVGQCKSCGGDALIRTAALRQVEGYNPRLIAGEEPELCVRLRAAGWKIWRLEAEMTLHDAAITRFGQWWQRSRRAGHAYAEGAALHGHAPERHNMTELRRIILWAILLPMAILAGAFISGWALLGGLIWPLQVLRLKRRGESWAGALFLTLGKFPEAQGALDYLRRRLTDTRPKLIEYK